MFIYSDPWVHEKLWLLHRGTSLHFTLTVRPRVRVCWGPTPSWAPSGSRATRRLGSKHFTPPTLGRYYKFDFVLFCFWYLWKNTLPQKTTLGLHIFTIFVSTRLTSSPTTESSRSELISSVSSIIPYTTRERIRERDIMEEIRGVGRKTPPVIVIVVGLKRKLLWLRVAPIQVPDSSVSITVVHTLNLGPWDWRLTWTHSQDTTTRVRSVGRHNPWSDTVRVI